MSSTTLRAALVAAASAAALAAPAHAQEKVKFGTNWVAQAEHGGYYQAIADGTYADCGIEVEIVPGGPQVNNRALMLAGKIDFSMGGNMLQAFSAVREGIPLKVVAAHFQKEPQVILTHPGAASSFEDLKNLDTLFIGDNGYQSFYRWMMTAYGFKAETRKPYTFNPAPFIADVKSGQQGYVTSEPFAVETEGGFKPDVYVLADAGFSTYATTVETMQATIDAKPEVVKCFVEASSIGWANYLYGDPSGGNALIQAANTDMSDEQIAFSIQAMKDYGIVDSGDSETMGIGVMTDAKMQDFHDKMVEAGVIEPGLDLSKVYTTEFSNTGVALETKKKLVE